MAHNFVKNLDTHSSNQINFDRISCLNFSNTQSFAIISIYEIHAYHISMKHAFVPKINQKPYLASPSHLDHPLHLLSIFILQKTDAYNVAFPMLMVQLHAQDS